MLEIDRVFTSSQKSYTLHADLGAPPCDSGLNTRRPETSRQSQFPTVEPKARQNVNQALMGLGGEMILLRSRRIRRLWRIGSLGDRRC
jgi:hypothetical protein